VHTETNLHRISQPMMTLFRKIWLVSILTAWGLYLAADAYRDAVEADISHQLNNLNAQVSRQELSFDIAVPCALSPKNTPEGTRWEVKIARVAISPPITFPDPQMNKWGPRDQQVPLPLLISGANSLREEPRIVDVVALKEHQMISITTAPEYVIPKGAEFSPGEPKCILNPRNF